MSGGLRIFGLVDPRDHGQFRWHGWIADEPFGVGVVGGSEDDGALFADGVGSAVVDIGCGVKPDPGVAIRQP